MAHFPVKVEGKIVLWCTAVFNESTNAIEFPKPEDSNGANENLEAYWEQAGHNLSPLSELVQSYKAGYESGLNKSCEHKPTSEKIIDDNILKSNSAAKKSLDIKNNNYSKKSLDIKNNNYSKQSLKYK